MRYLVALATVALVATLVIVGSATGGQQAVTKKLSTPMTGAEEVPPADPDGSGVVQLKLKARKKTVCWEFTVMNIATATLAHIHKAPKGMNGPIVVNMSPMPPDADDGHWEGCATGVDKALIKDIIKNPTGYYVNVHNQDFPGGAIRGQLGD
jgi:hypothetical protein